MKNILQQFDKKFKAEIESLSEKVYKYKAKIISSIVDELKSLKCDPVYPLVLSGTSSIKDDSIVFTYDGKRCTLKISVRGYEIHVDEYGYGKYKEIYGDDLKTLLKQVKKPIPVPKILVNAMMTPDGTYLHSKHVHDYVTHKDKNGEEYMVDGGNEYLHRSVNTVPAKDMTIYDTDSFAKIRKNLTWGSRGKDGKQPLTYKTLMKMSNDHIENILKNLPGISSGYKMAFEKELELRKKKNIVIND